MRAIKKYFIFSVDRPEFSEPKKKHLRDIVRSMVPSHTEILGSYKGEPEISFIIPYRELSMNLLNFIFNDCNQECTLYVDHESSCYIMNNEFDIELKSKPTIGKLKSVPEWRALQDDSWSFNPNSKCYFIIE